MTLSTSVKGPGTVLLLLSSLVAALHAQDGVCKKDDLPTNFVAVEEFNSGMCDDGVDPLAKNAWRIEHVRDGITVCALPRYETIGPEVAELIPCEHIVSDRCSPRLDGLANAIVLRSPAQCAKRVLPEDLKINCSASVGLDNGKSGYMVAQVTSSTCPAAPASNRAGYVHTANAWLARKVDSPSKPDFLAICADDHNIGRSDYIVRRFKNNSCPVNPRVAGAQEGLTGWVIRLNELPPDIPQEKAYTFCEAFTKDSWKPFGENWIGYRAATSYSELCGGEDQKVNSFKVFRDINGVWFAEASTACIAGSWQIESDFINVNDPGNNWTYSISGDELRIKSLDGSEWGSYKRHDAGWMGSVGGNSSFRRDSFLSFTLDCKRARQLWTPTPYSVTWFRKVHD